MQEGKKTIVRFFDVDCIIEVEINVFVHSVKPHDLFQGKDYSDKYELIDTLSINEKLEFEWEGPTVRKVCNFKKRKHKYRKADRNFYIFIKGYQECKGEYLIKYS